MKTRLLFGSILPLTFLPIKVYSQTVKGQVFDVIAKRPIPGATVRNLKKKYLTLTDSAGNFALEAVLRDTLIVHALSYKDDTLVVGYSLNYKSFLAPKIQELNEVRVLTGGQSSMKLPVSPFHGQSMVYKYDYGGDELGGVVFRLWYWKKDDKKRQKKLRLDQETKADIEVGKLFTEGIVAKYLPLKSQDLKKFLNLYTPSSRHFKEFDSNLLLYLNHYYKIFVAEHKSSIQE